MPLDERTRIAWIRLARSDNVGPVTFTRLVERFGSAAAALDALPELARRGGARSFAVCSGEAAEREIAAAAAAGVQLIASCEDDYPPLLARIEDAPPLIALRGEARHLAGKAVGIVGTRNASLNGMRLTRMIAQGLGEAGFVVASGMARGIDGAAHEAALPTGTVAVLAGGVDIVYPREHQALYEKIVAQGAVVSEMPMGAEPHARLFPRRNRIISGMSRGVVVVEAAQRSGSLITARYALEQNREVFAVPGSPLDPRAQGANDLIRDGAHLVQNAADVVQILNGLFQSHLDEPAAAYNPQNSPVSPSEDALERARNAIVELLGPSPTGVDELIRQCQMSPAVVATVLLELELAGRLERHPGNQVSLVGPT